MLTGCDLTQVVSQPVWFVGRGQQIRLRLVSSSGLCTQVQASSPQMMAGFPSPSQPIPLRVRVHAAGTQLLALELALALPDQPASWWDVWVCSNAVMITGLCWGESLLHHALCCLGLRT